MSAVSSPARAAAVADAAVDVEDVVVEVQAGG